MQATVPIGDIDVRATLRGPSSVRSDPTVRLGPGRFARATTTPQGPGTIVVTWEPGGSDATVDTFGDGAAWLAARAPALLGCDDDPGDFAPATPPLHDLWKRNQRVRVGRTGTLWHDLACFVVQQRVTVVDASEQWRRLVWALGPPAPGDASLRVPPTPDVIAATTYHELHRFGIERQRADNLIAAAHAADRLQRYVDGDVEAAMPALRSVRGIGPWTASCLAVRTWGAADTVIVGDYGIPSMVAWLLAGERRADDERLLELLEPYRPHRYRVIQLAFASGAGPPRRAPRARRIDIRQL